MPHGHAFRRQKGKPNMREFVITDASMPRLDSALLAQYPQLSPGRLHKRPCGFGGFWAFSAGISGMFEGRMPALQ